jgi:hypothetical protein
MYNQNSGYGQALLNMVANQVPTFGRVFIVMDPDDTDEENYQRMQEIFTSDPNGRTRFFTSLSDAYDATESNNNDVILLDANSTHVVDEMLTVSKNRVHFIGMDGGGHLTAQGAKIQMGVTGVATDLAPVMVTGVRNSFRNVKVINASTTNQSLYGFIDNGEGTLIENCSMVKVAGLDDASWASFWMAGDSLTMRNCVIGQSNIPSAVAHFGILIDGKSGGASDVVKECFLENIFINMSVSTAAAATACFIKVADGSALNFNNVIKDLNAVNFVQAGTGTIMTDAVLGAATTGGYLHLIRPTFMGCTGVGAGAGQGIYISNSTAPDANGGLSTELTD